MNVQCALWLLLVGFANIGFANGKLVINEVMIYSPKATDPLTQWFELYNTGTTTIALSGYRLGYHIDGVSVNLIEVKTDKTVGPNGFFVIGNNGDTTKNGGVALDLVIDPGKPWETDGRGYNFVGLYTPSLTSVDDSFRWSTDDPGLPGIRYPFLPGSSLARVSPLDLTERLSNWAPSTSFINCDGAADKGTPGKANNDACSAPPNSPTKSPVSTKGKLVINEVMIYSPKATDPLTQWFELYNTGTTTIALSGYRLEYHINGVSVNLIEVKTDKTVGPNGFFVIGNNGDTTKNGGVALDLVIDPGKPWETDGRGYNFVGLYTPSLTSVDDSFRCSTDDPGLPGIRYPFLPGSSLARVSPLDLTERLSNWVPSTSFINCDGAADKGTPGKANNFACSAPKSPTKAPIKASTPPPKSSTRAPVPTPPPKSSTRAPVPTPPPKSSTRAPVPTPPPKSSTRAPVPTPPPKSSTRAPVPTPPPKSSTRAPVPTPTPKSSTRGPVLKTDPSPAPKGPTLTPPPKAVLPTLPPTIVPCGAFRLGLFCFNGCGFWGRLLGRCPK